MQSNKIRNEKCDITTNREKKSRKFQGCTLKPILYHNGKSKGHG